MDRKSEEFTQVIPPYTSQQLVENEERKLGEAQEIQGDAINLGIQLQRELSDEYYRYDDEAASPEFKQEKEIQLSLRERGATPKIQIDPLFNSRQSITKMKTQEYKDETHFHKQKSQRQEGLRQSQTARRRQKDQEGLNPDISNQSFKKVPTRNDIQMEDIRFVTEEFSRNFSSSFRVDESELMHKQSELLNLTQSKLGKPFKHTRFTPNHKINPQFNFHRHSRNPPNPPQPSSQFLPDDFKAAPAIMYEPHLDPHFLRKMLIECDQQRKQFETKWQSMMGYMLQAYDEQEKLIGQLKSQNPQISNSGLRKQEEANFNQVNESLNARLRKQSEEGQGVSLRRVSVPISAMQHQRVTLNGQHQQIFTTYDHFDQMQQLFDLNTDRSKQRLTQNQHHQSYLTVNNSQKASRLPSMRRATLQNTINSRRRKDGSQHLSSTSNHRVKELQTPDNNGSILFNQRRYSARERQNSKDGKQQQHSSLFTIEKASKIQVQRNQFDIINAPEQDFINQLRGQLIICHKIISKDKEDKLRLVKRLKDLNHELNTLKKKKESGNALRISEMKEHFAAHHKSQRSSLKSIKNYGASQKIEEGQLIQKIQEALDEQAENSDQKIQSQEEGNELETRDQNEEQQDQGQDMEHNEEAKSEGITILSQPERNQESTDEIRNDTSMKNIMKQSPVASSHHRLHSFSKHIQNTHSTSKFALDHQSSSTNFKILLHDDFEESRLRENVSFWKEKVDILLQEKKEALQEQMTQHKLIRNYELQLEELKAKVKQKDEVIETIAMEQKVQSTRMNGGLTQGLDPGMELESLGLEENQKFTSGQSKQFRYDILEGAEVIEDEAIQHEDDIDLLQQNEEEDLRELMCNAQLVENDYEDGAERLDVIDSLIQTQDMEGLQLYHKFIDEKAQELLNQRESVLSEIRQESLQKHSVRVFNQQNNESNYEDRNMTLPQRQDEIKHDHDSFIRDGIMNHQSQTQSKSPGKIQRRGQSYASYQNKNPSRLNKQSFNQVKDQSANSRQMKQSNVVMHNNFVSQVPFDAQQLKPIRLGQGNNYSYNSSLQNHNLLKHQRQMSNSLAPVLGSARDQSSSHKKRQEDFDKSTSRSPHPLKNQSKSGVQIRQNEADIEERIKREFKEGTMVSESSQQQDSPEETAYDQLQEDLTQRVQQERPSEHSMKSSSQFQNSLKQSKDLSPSLSQNQDVRFDQQRINQSSKKQGLSKLQKPQSKTRGPSNSNKKIQNQGLNAQKQGAQPSRAQYAHQRPQK